MIGSAPGDDGNFSMSKISKVAGHNPADVAVAASFEISPSAGIASKGSCISATRKEDSEETYVSGDRCSVNVSFPSCGIVDAGSKQTDLLDSALECTGFVGSASSNALILGDCGEMMTLSVSTTREGGEFSVETVFNGDCMEE